MANHLYFRTSQKIARVAKTGGAIELLATTPASYRRPGGLAVDASGVYFGNDDADPSVYPSAWKGSLWHMPKAGGGARELASLAEVPSRIVLDDRSVYFVSGGFNYAGPGGKFQGTGGVRAIDKKTGWERVLADDPCAQSLTLDANAVYWTSCDPSDGMILSGGLYRVAKWGAPLTRVPLTMEGAVQFPSDVALHGGRFYFLHSFEMSSNDHLCSIPKAGGAADWSIVQPRGRTRAYLFDGDDLWQGVVPDHSGIDAMAMKGMKPTIQVSSLTTPDRIGRFAVEDLDGLAVDENDVYWSTGHEIRARAKATVARGPD